MHICQSVCMYVIVRLVGLDKLPLKIELVDQLGRSVSHERELSVLFMTKLTVKIGPI